MIGLRQTIERGMKHRWLGPLFVILFCVLMALVCLHGIYDAHHGATESGEICLGLIVMFAFLIVIRLCWQVTITLAPVLSGRAPPGARTFRLPARWVALAAPVPLRR